MLAVLQHALLSPQLHFSDIQTFRQQFILGTQHYSTAFNALYLGAQSATPGMAFLAGYQNAIRCLDVNCPSDELAAFCVSEKGVKKPWDMTTQLSSQGGRKILNGKKGYVMLMPNELDRLYVVAKNDEGQLCCVYLPSDSLGVSATEPLKAPFVEDIPHSGVSFDQVVISSEQLLDIDGHQQANKPFRYWEDVHVALAMLGWVLRQQIEARKSLQELSNEIHLIEQLNTSFEETPDYYTLDSIALLDQCHEMMDAGSKNVSESAQKLWMKDRLLLQMGQKIRHLIRAKLTR
jgi:hypothetical protein